MAGSKIDVSQIKWSEAISENITISGTLIVTGSIRSTGDLVLDDGGSLKEAGGTAAITFDGSGHVTKIGQDSPSTDQVLTWDGSKAVWSASAGGGGGLSFDGSTANGVCTFKDSDEATVESNLTFDGSTLIVSANLKINEYLYHNGDTDTFIRFQDDDIVVEAGGVNFIKITEDGTQDKIILNNGGADVDFIVKSPNESKALYINSGNEVFHINHGESDFTTKIHNTNDLVVTVDSTGIIFNDDSHDDIDFRIETANEDEAFFVDGSADTIYINKGKSSVTTVIKNTNEEAIRIGAAGIVFNEYSHASIDFRVESDSNTHMLFVDAGTDLIGINDSDPISELSVAGKISITSESSTPSAPADGHGWLYTKTDGKVYWQSADIAETDLTSGGGGSDTFVSDNFGHFKFTTDNLFGHYVYAYNSRNYQLTQNLYGNSYANYDDPDDSTFTATIVNSLLYIKSGIVPVACTLDSFTVEGYLVEAMSNGNAKFSIWHATAPSDATAYSTSVTWTRVATVTWSGTGADDTWYKGTDTVTSGNSFAAGDWYATTVQPSGTDTSLSSGNSSFHASISWSPT